MTSTTWHGRRGPVLLGPTEHRVATWLRDMTRSGRVTIRNAELASSCRVTPHEAYRITRRLRILGLFGIENDQGGSKGGRRYWRTAIEHDAAALNQERHRVAWARLVAWARSQARRSAARLDSLRARHHTRGRARDGLPASSRLIGQSAASVPASSSPPGDAGTFADRMRRAGLGRLMDDWGLV